MKEISARELKSWIDENRDFLIVDVREEYEYQWSNLGGKCIPMAELVTNPSSLPKDKDVVLHCNSGMRAAALIDVLEKEYGFTNLINLVGGIEEFAAQIDPSLSADK